MLVDHRRHDAPYPIFKLCQKKLENFLLQYILLGNTIQKTSNVLNGIYISFKDFINTKQMLHV